MNVNQLKVVPTEETRIYLSSALSGSPLDLDLDDLSVVLMHTTDALEYDPSLVFAAQATSVRVWYDTYLQQSSLIVSLVSDDMNRRVLALHEQGVVREFYPYFNPYLVLKRGMPPLSTHYRQFVVRTANVLCADERPLYFTGESAEQVDLPAPPDYEYNEAMAEERGIRNDV